MRSWPLPSRNGPANRRPHQNPGTPQKMKILAVDTSTQTCSVALMDGEALIAETTTGFARQTHARRLMGMIVHLLAEAGLACRRGRRLGRCSGTGSFTGLRIGISSIKGLAAAIGKPVAGVSSLEALAWQCLAYNGRIYPMIDARKPKCTRPVILPPNGVCRCWTPERVITPDKVLTNSQAPASLLAVGAWLYRDLILDASGNQRPFAPAWQHHVRASTVAHLAWQRFKQGKVGKNGQLVPDYVRKSDAQINLSPKT